MKGHGPLALILVGLLGLTLFVFAQSYEGRKNVIAAQRAGCLRGIRDREALINVTWVVGHDPATDGNRPLELALAVADAKLVQAAEAGSLPAPLRRYATFSCVRAYPAASAWP